MFTRSSDSGQKGFAARIAGGSQGHSQQPLPPIPPTQQAPPAAIAPPSFPVVSPPAAEGTSVIGNDLTILGQNLTIISRGTVQLDGEIHGNLHGAEIVIGERGKVTGTVAAEKVVVRGQVDGVIRGLKVAIEASARVDGDIHHQSLIIDKGAHFEGRCKRPKDPAELKPVLEVETLSASDIKVA
jgi:cytoskeletal protein CcmA (bactofilin family)